MQNSNELNRGCCGSGGTKGSKPPKPKTGTKPYRPKGW